VNALVVYQGKNFVPLLASGHATDDFITPVEAAAMVADPERYCDAEQGEVVSAYRVAANGDLVYLPHSGFASLVKEMEAGRVPAEAASILLTADPIEAIMLHIREDYARRGVGTLRERLAQWHPNAAIPSELATKLKEALPSRVTRPPNNSAGKKAQLALMRAAGEEYRKRAAAAGMTLDFRSLPGTKAGTLRILKEIDTRIARSVWTFEKYCEEDLGWRWRQGTRRQDAQLFSLVCGD